MSFSRSSGVLLHPTSFPGKYGIGDLGPYAYQFIDFLERSGQSVWQILPLGPTSYGDSPYQSFSAFAGNPLMVNPDFMVDHGFLNREALTDVPPFPEEKVDFGWVIFWKNQLFEQGYRFFQDNKRNNLEGWDAFETFCAAQAGWLDDYALFMAVKGFHVAHKGGVWSSWPADIRDRKPAALKAWRTKLEKEIETERFKQFLFFKQWREIKAYANQRGIQIIGDMPIFVAFDSADVWANRDLFYLNGDGEASVVAGVPPDYFSETGQRWGNPLYKWEKMAERDYAWWTERLKKTFETVDILRIDHFRGFESYWEIPAQNETAIEGEWKPGPGLPFFKRLTAKLGQLPIIAEDLGVITPEVVALREGTGFPGMKILQFGFEGDSGNAFLPHNYDTDCVVYTGSHDNETTVGWYQNGSDQERDHVRRYLGRDGSDIAWDLIRLGHQSVAIMSVIPLQDLFSLDNRARMNFPGKVGGYWSWRYAEGMLNGMIEARLRDLTVMYNRQRK